jgi:hypothetical protein
MKKPNQIPFVNPSDMEKTEDGTNALKLLLELQKFPIIDLEVARLAARDQ